MPIKDEPLTGAALARWCYDNPNLAARTIEGLRGWRCFQCDEVFTERDEALLHFGLMETVPPRCCIDDERYRLLHAKLMLKDL